MQDRYGDSSVLHLDDVPMPTIGDDDVLIEVRATSLNIGDIHLMTGLPLIMRPFVGFKGPRQRIRGMDVAGMVHSVGSRVTAFRPGDEVFGVVDAGLAEYARASVKKIAPKPASLSFEQASAIPTSAATALHALRDTGHVQAGQKVLIIGASGGVGIFATQLAKAFGAHVTGVANTAKLDLVRSLGADEVIDYTTTDFTRSGLRYDLIIDMASTHTFADLRRILATEGTLVIVGGEAGGRFTGGVGRAMTAPLRSIGSKQKLKGLISATLAGDLMTLAELVQAGSMMPVIDGALPLSSASEAVARMRSRGVGKVVLTPWLVE
ncbi:NAD(P)-dependent alcohol dehydrogenase [Conyzicola nivalis]|uniref:NADPH:quinone reductase n=1 Tax=Conyzicola nivalis TaxID=1477021 RepID=A0A916SHF3_9MICO|nr:NAD(P)-dependent alcohol dehydrogenase [Conyzicola nivalis]GGB00409.1 NADPH:quinone reductase [Conyzicola nivalis]